MKYIILLLFSVFVGCAKDGVSVESTDNFDFKVTELFTHKGCTTYRFRDDGKYHYYVNCSCGPDTTISTRIKQNGKVNTKISTPLPTYSEEIP